jgi:predicted transcriptional regulator
LGKVTEFFKKKEKRDTPFTVRLPKSVTEKLKQLADATNMSQSEVIEELVRFYEAKTGEKQVEKK